jgi:hypothetical protein
MTYTLINKASESKRYKHFLIHPITYIVEGHNDLCCNMMITGVYDKQNRSYETNEP